MTSHLKLESGFTLVESMIAMVLIAFIAGEMAMVNISATRSTQIAKQTVKANALADEALEKCRNWPYINMQTPITGLSEGCVLAANVATCTSAAPIEGIYTRARIVRPLDAANATTTIALSRKADVVVTVTFTDARGALQRVSVASVMTSF